MGTDGPLPFILAGPILRRVEPSRVCVWIATSCAFRLTGIVYDATATEQFGEGSTSTLKLGNALHVAVVEIEPTRKPTGSRCGTHRAFPKRKLLAYDLIFERLGDDGKAVRGAQKLLLSNLTSSKQGRNELAYNPYDYPTFYINDISLNILHGSCRKAHGRGDDALASADTLLQITTPKPDSKDDLTKRPSTLLLTGDQIYADDVHDALITLASNLGRQVLGFDENVPKIPGPVHLLDPKRRREFASRIFSPDEGAKNQLLCFGDFAGLYLMAFNQERWPDRSTLPSDLRRFYDALPAVRRALANISTYMTMDDHEICDDWNISKAWEQRALGEDTQRNPFGALGKRVIAHGLCAYWAFQAWGNQPDKFDKSFRDTIVKYFADHGGSGDALESLLLTPQDKDRNRWFFVVPTTPPIFFLDSRTRRGANTLNPHLPSALLDDTALLEFQAEMRALQVNDDWLVVVAQTPVFVVPVAEASLEALAYGYVTGPFGGRRLRQTIEQLDLEHWHNNRSGYYNLLSALHAAGPAGCIILSGDVHYAFVARATITVAGETLQCTQFTSSPLKNEIEGGLFGNVGLNDRSKFMSLKPEDPSRVNEHGWMQAPKGVSRPTDRVRDILAVSPTVLSDTEVVDAAINLQRSKPDLEIIEGTIRPTSPSGGPCVHLQTNLGQLVLSADGRATLRLYGAANANPFATYDLWLGKPKPLPPSLPPIPDPMEIFFQKDRPRPEDLSGDLTVLTNEGLRNLTMLAKILRDDPTLNVHLTGRASIEGPPEDPKYNYDLGTRRATWVAARLGIDIRRIADPPGYKRADDCRAVSPGIVTCGAAEANPAIDPCDRQVLVEFFRSA